jgi:hypothetical protein
MYKTPKRTKQEAFEAMSNEALSTQVRGNALHDYIHYTLGEIYGVKLYKILVALISASPTPDAEPAIHVDESGKETEEYEMRAAAYFNMDGEEAVRMLSQSALAISVMTGLVELPEGAGIRDLEMGSEPTNH